MGFEPTLDRGDDQARAAALDVTRSFIVQAPAGSGKTELLIQRYLHLLTIVDNPEEVLAITFTRKATAEMRLRVLEALQGAERGEQPREAHRALTHEVAEAVLRRDMAHGWGIVQNPRRLRIQSLDALNASILRMRPLTMAGTGLSVAEGAELVAIYRRAAVATLDLLSEDDAVGAATRDVLTHLDGDTQTYIESLSRMLATRDQWLTFVGSGLLSDSQSAALRRGIESDLEYIVVEQLRTVRSIVPGDVAAELGKLAAHAALNLRLAGDPDHAICAFGEAPEIPPAQTGGLRSWQALAELLLTRDGDVRKQVNVKQGFQRVDAGQKKAMHALLESLANETDFIEQLHAVRTLPPHRYDDEQWSVLLSLFRLLPTAVAELRRSFLALGVTDHTEVALGAQQALGSADSPGDVALLLDYQIRHILVDEMQDTSLAQYHMLEALTGGWQFDDGRTLFCVGDPMQSIYRFRDAEVAQFMLARQNGIASVPLESLTLQRNFRSGARLVDWFNQVFPDTLPASEDPASGAVPYSDSISADTLEGQGESHVYPVFGTHRAQEATVATSIVCKTLAEHPDDTMAVLVRSRSHTPALLASLREAGVAYQAIDIDRPSDLPEIIEISALTRALEHLGDRVAWLALLRSPWVGLDWTDLHQLVRDAATKTVLELLQEPARCAGLSEFGQQAVRGFMARIEPHLVTDRSRPLHERVERAWFALGGPALLEDENAVANVYHYLRVLSRLEVGGSLPDAAALLELLDDEHVSSEVPARLQIMTIHKAKGLEFDHVLLHGLGRTPRTGDSPVVNWLDLPNELGEARKIIGPIGRRDEAEDDPIHRFIRYKEATKDKHEQARLLYVACTRARKTLHLVGNVTYKSGDENFSTPPSNALLHLLWPAVEQHYIDAFAKVEKSYNGARRDWVAPTLRRFSVPWTAPISTLVPGLESGVPLRSGTRQVSYEWVGTEARLAGTIVHRWLQLAAVGQENLTPDRIRALRPSSEHWSRELGAGDDLVEAICDRVSAALTGVVSDDTGRWLLEPGGEAELALSGIVEGRVESIVIDRVCIDEHGTHWIVDYKTSSHEGGDLAGFLDSERQRHTEQLRKYAHIYKAYRDVPIRCALYFPLLQAFIEVDL